MAATPPEPRLTGWISAIKGLTLGNALVIILLTLALAPVYILVAQPEILDRFLSSYEVLDERTGCTLRKARERGENYTWLIAAGFAFAGDTRWSVGVSLQREPTPEDIESYCATLLKIIDSFNGSIDGLGQ